MKEFVVLCILIGAVLVYSEGKFNFLSLELYKEPILVSEQKPLVNSSHQGYCDCTDNFEGKTIQLTNPNAREERILKEIIETYGLSGRIYKLCKTKRFKTRKFAAYAKRKNNLRYIVYSEQVLKRLTETLALFLLLHEFHHHTSGHCETNELWSHSHEKELEADAFAGAGMYLMGKSLEEALSYHSPHRKATKIHPSGKASRAAIRQSYMQQEKRDKYLSLNQSASLITQLLKTNL